MGGSGAEHTHNKRGVLDMEVAVMVTVYPVWREDGAELGGDMDGRTEAQRAHPLHSCAG